MAPMHLNLENLQAQPKLDYLAVRCSDGSVVSIGAVISGPKTLLVDSSCGGGYRAVKVAGAGATASGNGT